MSKRPIKTESKRVIKTDGLSLKDVVDLKKIAIEWERQETMYEAENHDTVVYYFLPDIKPTGALTEAEKESIFDERAPATQFWGEIIHVPGITVEEKAAALKARRGRKLERNVWCKLLLDLVVDITPLDKPVPNTLIALLRDELGLPKNHDVGGWPLTAGMRRDSGGSNHEARHHASLIDCQHIEALLTHKDETIRSDAAPMPLNELQRKVKAKLGRAPATKTLREWRENLNYWNLTQHHRQAQFGAGGKGK